MNPAERFFNTPIALAKEYEHVIIDRLFARRKPLENGGTELVTKKAVTPLGRGDSGTSKPYGMLGSVAIVPIRGVLVHARHYYDEQSYDAIAASMFQAAGDPEVKAIAMMMESPGGEVNGMFDLADAIYTLRKAKPIVAVVDEYAFSAAYAIASSASMITVSRTGGTGSIGVILMHTDMSKMLEDVGIKVTAITYGDRKADFSPTQPLSDDARKRAQAEVDTLGEMFVELVARNRKLKPAAVRKTEAGTFLGSAGVEQGLADKLMAPEDALANLVAQFK